MDLDPPTVRLAYVTPQQSFRLIALPPSILESPPSSLQLRSLPPPPDAPASSTAYNVVLCTPTKTFNIRQSHTSNSVYLLQGTNAIGKTTSYLELLPSTPDAAKLLREQLPYVGTKRALRDDLPLSDGEFDEAWKEIMAYEKEGRCMIPTAGDVVKAFAAMWLGCAAEGVGIEKGEVVLRHMVETVDEEEEGVCLELVEAVVRSVSQETVSGRVRVDRDRVCAIAGREVLREWGEEKSSGRDMLYPAFMAKWKKAVPDVWTSGCKLETLKDCHTLPTPNTIRYNPLGGTASGSAGGSQDDGGTGNLPTRNKWHEMFRRDKKQ